MINTVTEEELTARLHRAQKININKVLGITIDSLSLDRCESTLTVCENNINPFGYIHGGALCTAADNCAGTLAHADGRKYVTESININYLGNVRTGTVHITANRIKSGRRSSVIEVYAVSETGTPIIFATVTMCCIADTYSKS